MMDAEFEVNPARAGMIRLTAPVVPGPSRKPRASGDDPWGLRVSVVRAW